MHRVSNEKNQSPTDPLSFPAARLWGERAFLKQNKVRGLASVKQPIYTGGKEGYLLHLKIWPENCGLH